METNRLRKMLSLYLPSGLRSKVCGDGRGSRLYSGDDKHHVAKVPNSDASETIAAAVNALPALLDAAEALGTLLDWAEREGTHPQGAEVWFAVRDDARRALAALNGDKPCCE